MDPPCAATVRPVVAASTRTLAARRGGPRSQGWYSSYHPPFAALGIFASTLSGPVAGHPVTIREHPVADPGCPRAPGAPDLACWFWLGPAAWHASNRSHRHPPSDGGPGGCQCAAAANGAAVTVGSTIDVNWQSRRTPASAGAKVQVGLHHESQFSLSVSVRFPSPESADSPLRASGECVFRLGVPGPPRSRSYKLRR